MSTQIQTSLCFCLSYRKCKNAEDRLFAIKRGFRRSSATPAYRAPIVNKTTSLFKVRKIPVSLLSKPPESSDVGEGKFGVCTKMYMQCIPVCIKEHRENDVYAKEMLLHEASILSELCHESVCFLLGIQMECLPYCIVLNLYSVDGFCINIHDILSVPNITSDQALSPKQYVMKSVYESLDMKAWLEIMIKVVEGLLYIHKLDIVHRDLKADNIVFYRNSGEVRPVIVDFGKSEHVSATKMYVLTDIERAEYKKKYKYIAPDLVDGISKPSSASDIYSYGRLFKNIICYFPLNVSELKVTIKEVVKACLKYNSTERPSCNHVIEVLKHAGMS